MKSSQQKPGSMHSVNLTDFVKMHPTPTNSMVTYQDFEQAKYHSSKRSKYSEITKQTGNGQLNPTWVEWLMGFPLHWTEL
jgi:hypothetical protein